MHRQRLREARETLGAGPQGERGDGSRLGQEVVLGEGAGELLQAVKPLLAVGHSALAPASPGWG